MIRSASLAGCIRIGSSPAFVLEQRSNFSRSAELLQSRRCRRHSSAASRPRAPQQKRCVRARSSYEPYPWDESQYYEAALQLVQGTLEGGAQGYLLLMRANLKPGQVTDDDKGLVLAIGGDTMRSISLLTQNSVGDRPLALDLMWQILERGREVSKRDWQLVRVAIVELRGAVFIGRLFFGDSSTGRVVWDCDSRPSDGIWLAMKAKCPLYVHKKVWEENATPLGEMRDPTDLYQGGGGAGAMGDWEPGKTGTAGKRRKGGSASTPGRGSRAGPPPSAGEEGGGEDPSQTLTKISSTDPEPLKRLKMEMKVALKEEDYGAAARIRDHPFMKMHLEIMELVKAGRESEASDLEAKLHEAVEQYERSGGGVLGDLED